MPYILPNVSFGILAVMPQGWLFMAAIILLECLFLSKYLSKSNWSKKVSIATIVSNISSGGVGFVLSLWLNGGWYLVIWFPWVSSNEIKVPRDLPGLAIYYLIAFVLSVMIECAIEYLFLRRVYGSKQIFKGCLFANCLSYALGSILMYLYSFGLI